MLGVSKRLSELLLLAIDSTVPRMLSLRLGNVLASSGSVVPLFMQSLESHQPLKVSDPEAARYFLTLEEAATFLLKSLQIPESSLLLPEMGSPRRIVELAEFLLNEFGRENGSRTMRFTGLRPGEKCSEQLTFDHEYLRKTKTPHLYEVCGNSISDPERFANDFGRLMELVLHRSKKGLIESLSNLVPEFAPSAALLRYLC
jgi:FlaA1/EpsC-like NDP-sugar epimerase